ncbi:hypothetical protein AWJ20_3405 [Sugiyamaella lignohabitans]|uniref:Uncharacterized protein n=1 Tax=Sugiyamaella lignohabitans TaxID=796027 RepID=A0A167FVR9_9ASCO|nr:uncharacterized protein AWJ20_3405 [Sugiyamaella lignohabitans]ANB15761.1 hypothetical protein AWJ20_3405 [Sugiyamaella lignohabitans]
MILDRETHHKHHVGGSIQDIRLTQSTPSSTTASVTKLLRRSSSTCSGNSEFGSCALPTQNQTLPIVLGVTIPVVFAICLLVYLHFRHLKRLKMEEIADKDIDVDMDDYDTSLANHQPVQPPNEKFNRYPDQSSTRRGSMETTSNSINPDNPFYARAPYMMHPELTSSKHSLEEYSRSLHTMMDSNVYPSNTSIYSSNSGSRPISPKFPFRRDESPVPSTRLNSNLGVEQRQSGSSGTSYISSDRTDKGNSMVSPPSTVAYSPDTASNPMLQQQMKLEEQITSAMPTPPERAYHRESVNDDNNHNSSRDSIRYSQEFKTRVLSHAELPDHNFDESKNSFSFEQEESGESIESNRGDLDRSLTKQFERVKSIYREYMPDSPETTPVLGLSNEDIESQPLENSVEAHHERADLQFEQRSMDLHEQSFESQGNHDTPSSSAQVYRNGQHEQHYEASHPESYDDSLPQGQDEFSNEYGQGNYSEQHTSFQQQYPVHPEQYPNAYRHNNLGSPLSPYQGHTGSVSPNYNRTYTASPEPSRQVTPLTDLAKLPVPHNLDEHDSPLAYAPQRRHNKGAASPIPAFNPLNNWSNEDVGLPSPHELRKSVALMNFAPPKKFVGAGSSAGNSRAGSLASSVSSPTGQWGASSPLPVSLKARPSSQLVPDAKDTQMLRPQMDMR